MKTNELLKSNYGKVLLSLIAIVVGIALWQNGYEFGKWLKHILH